MGYILMAICGYLLGCSNMALYLSKWKKVDLTNKGSGNLGASNAAVLMGFKAGILVGAHDVLKAAAAVLLAKFLFPDLEHIGAVAGVASVLGHIFPFYLKFKGGKGFASYYGMTLALNWRLAIVVGVLIVALTILTDYIVVGTFTTIVTVPAWEGFTKSWILATILLVATAVIIYKHRENCVRILRKEEIGLRSTLKGENRVK